METIVKINRIISYFSPVIVLIYLVIVAAVLLGTFNFGLGAELGFNQCIAVTMYTSLPGIIKALLAIVVILLGATGNFTFQNPDRQQPERAGRSELALPLHPAAVDRRFHHLDAGVGRHRFLLPDQGLAGHLPGGRVRLVAGVHPVDLGAWGSLFLRKIRPPTR